MSARVPPLPRKRALTVALALGALACDGPDLPKSWALAHPRVLALRSEVVGDESRATPEPGETLRARVLIAGRDPVERLSYALLACPAVEVSGELPACGAEPFAQLTGVIGDDAPFTGELALELELPGQDALRGVEEVLLAGAACTDGDPRGPGDERADDCRGSDEPALTWFAHVALARDARDYNRNPELPDDAIEFDGELWPTAVPADGDGAEPVVQADGEEHEIAVDLGDSGREEVDGEPETLLLSHFTSAGPLQRRFTALESDMPDDEPLTVQWRSPKPPPDVAPPDRATLVFVLRDERGGVAFTRRELAIERD